MKPWPWPNGGAVALRWCRNGHRKKASEGVVEIEMQNTCLVSCISKSLLHHTGHSWKTKHTHTKPHKKPGAVTVMHCFNWTQELGLYYAFVLCFIMKFQVHDVGCSDVKSVIFVFNLLTFFINVNKSITQPKVVLCFCAYKSLSPMPLLSLSAFTPL